MDPKIVDLITDLAHKLGQTAENLWPSAVRYVAVDAAVTAAVCFVATIGLAIAAAKLGKAGFKLYNGGNYREEFAGMLMIVGCVVAVCVCLATLSSFMSSLPAAIDPAGYLTVSVLRGCK